MTLSSTTPSDDQSSYLTFAKAALQQYELGPTDVEFIQQNAGIVFHVIKHETKQHYVLKIHKRVGKGDDPTAEQLEPGLDWLASFAQASDVTVQTPIRTRAGRFVAQVVLPWDATPVACTVQQWVEGRLPNGDLTTHNVYELGKMTAKLHAFSSTYAVDPKVSATHHDTHALSRNTHLLRETLSERQLSSRDYLIVLAAQRRIAECMSVLGWSSAVWGPVHGDLHYDNVILYGEDIRPIDFTGLRLAHFMYDIGVTMYHIFHQGSEIRRSYFAGYEEVRALPIAYGEYVEAFRAYAAIDNVAWNSTIPEQREHWLFRVNVDNLIHTYCRSVVEQHRFLFG